MNLRIHIFYIVIVFFITSCQGKKKNKDPFANPHSYHFCIDSLKLSDTISDLIIIDSEFYYSRIAHNDTLVGWHYYGGRKVTYTNNVDRENWIKNYLVYSDFYFVHKYPGLRLPNSQLILRVTSNLKEDSKELFLIITDTSNNILQTRLMAEKSNSVKRHIYIESIISHDTLFSRKLNSVCGDTISKQDMFCVTDSINITYRITSRGFLKQVSSDSTRIYKMGQMERR